jgi:tetratricopeptide (TPR) repeat protein
VATRHELRVALVALLAVATPGCAGNSFTLPWSKTAKSSSAKTFDDLAVQNTPQHKPSTFKKTTDSITEALTIKPKVIPAKDATSLDSSPGKIGADLYVRAARIHESRGNFEAAAAEYDKALEAEPKDLSALVGYARLHDRQQNFVEAERLYHEATTVDASSALVWNDLGLCYARQRKHQQAVNSLDKAIHLQPQNQMYRNNVATVLVEMGQVDKAWAHLTAANPPAVAHYNMGYLLNKQGQRQLAVQHLQLAIAADGSLAAAEQLLAQLQGQSSEYGETYASMPAAVSSYSISDQDQGLSAPPVEMTDSYMASSDANQIVNPLAPSTRRSATYRMPPTSEHASDPAPRPERLPEVTEEPQYSLPPLSEPTLELGNPAAFPARKISHEVEESEIQQPKNVIRLLGGEPMSAPIPNE